MKIYSSKDKSWSDSEGSKSKLRKRRVAGAEELSEDSEGSECSEGSEDSQRKVTSASKPKMDAGKGHMRRGPVKAAEDDVDDDMGDMDDMGAGTGEVEVDADVEGLVFDPQDVADLLAEVTGEDIEAELADDGDSITFRVGEEEYEVQADDDTDVLEARRIPASKKAVKANKAIPRGRVVRTIRK